jgi:hypothetical protein
MAKFVEVTGLVAPAVVLVPLTVLRVVLDVSEWAVVVVLLWTPAVTVDSLGSVSGRRCNWEMGERMARIYLVDSLGAVVSVVVAGGWQSFSTSSGTGESTYRSSSSHSPW